MELSYKETAPASKFNVNNDGTVLDKETGLMWMRCTDGLSGTDCKSGKANEYDWSKAVERAKQININGFAGYKDWRIPNERELFSIVEHRCERPAVNIAIFPNTQNKWYWTSNDTNSTNDTHTNTPEDYPSQDAVLLFGGLRDGISKSYNDRTLIFVRGKEMSMEGYRR